MYGGVRIHATGLGRAMLPLGIWIAASLLLAYAPVWFQRKLMMGIHLPVCMIAAVGLDDLARRVSTGRKWAYAGVVVASLAFTAVTHVRNFDVLRNDVRQDVGAFYVTPDLRRAFRFLAEHTDPDSVVLAAYEATRLIPGAAGNTVTYGHWAQSIDVRAHVAWLRRVFGPPGAMSAADRQRELRESAIDYVFIDQTMLREWLRGRIPEWLATVGATVYSGPGVRIIEVAKEHGKR